MPTYHEVLGVREDASRREVNAAYRRLAKKYHPDVAGGDAAIFQQVTEAYNALTIRGQRQQTPEAVRPVDPAPRQAPNPPPRPGFLRRRAYLMLAFAAFVLGLFLLDRGDGIHAAFRPGLLVAGGFAILFSAGFFASRRREYAGLSDALEQAVLAVLRFFLDIVMRVYMALLFVFAVVALLALVNWLEAFWKW
jgi:curved DNA-binding protein CbpA